MGKVHVVNAKRMGWEQMYDCYTFPVEHFSRETAMAEFVPVQRTTVKSNGNSYPYTAYKYGEKLYRSISYYGIADDSDFE